MAERIDKLRLILTELRAATTGYPTYLAHLVPDAVLFQLALDVFEQASAVATLAVSPTPRAAMANSRAAFEAFLDMLSLVSDPARYDEHGAFVRACELLTQEDLQRRRAKADSALGLTTAPEGASPEQIVETEGAKWESGSPESLRMFRRVLAQAREDGRWKRHWSGAANRSEQARQIAHWLKAEGGFADIADAMYGLQSFETHPGPRSGRRAVTPDGKGGLNWGPRDDDAELPIAMGEVSCAGALQALSLRRTTIK